MKPGGDLRTVLLLVLIGVLTACATPTPSRKDAADAGLFHLQLLHFADVDGGGTQALETAEAFSALVQAARQRDPAHTLLVSSGDNFIPGPLYLASQDGAMAAVIGQPGPARGEIALLNAMGVQASSVGNHDLDGGPSVLADVMAPEGEWPGSMFPWLAANLDSAGEPDLHALRCEKQTLSDMRACLAPFAIANVADRRVGLVGAVTPALPALTKTGELLVRPSQRRDLDALAASIQASVDALVADGVDIVVLLAHMQQIRIEQALAQRLAHVDVIVAGGSNTVLANPGDVLHPGDVAQGPYPLQAKSRTGEPVMVLNVDGDFRYLGRARLVFDAQGVLIPERFEGGPLAALDEVTASWQGQSMAAVTDLVAAFSTVLEEKAGHVLGYTDVFLDGRRSRVRTGETNLGRLTAEANLWLARQQEPSVSLAIKNGGGIRAPIGDVVVPPGASGDEEPALLPPAENAFKPAGAVSRLDVETALAFNSRLVALSVSVAELRDVLEHALAGLAPGASPGAFPQVAGMRVRYDASAPPRRVEPGQPGDRNQGMDSTGQRVREIALRGDDGEWQTVFVDGQWLGDPQQRLRLVTLDFLAQCVPGGSGWAGEDRPDCGDGYPFAELSAPNRRDLVAQPLQGVAIDFAPANSEQYALAAYLRRFHNSPEAAFDVASTPVAEAARLQPLASR